MLIFSRDKKKKKDKLYCMYVKSTKEIRVKYNTFESLYMNLVLKCLISERIKYNNKEKRKINK